MTSEQVMTRMNGLKNNTAKTCKEMQAFKKKWDGRRPRKNSNAFAIYCADAEKATEALEKHFGFA